MMQLSTMGRRLLLDLESAHESLAEHAGADAVHRRAFRSIYELFAAALDAVGDSELSRAPSPEEWSMAEVVEHVSEHDRKYGELVGQGLNHYVLHGLEHAQQLWKMRAEAEQGSEC